MLLNRQDTSQLDTGTLVSYKNLLYLVLAQLFTTPKLLDPLLGRDPAGKAHPAREASCFCSQLLGRDTEVALNNFRVCVLKDFGVLVAAAQP